MRQHDGRARRQQNGESVFVFGVHITSPEVFDRHCLPGIAAFGGRDATLITTDEEPAAKACNDIIETAAGMDDVEAIVLLEENIEITDPQFLAKASAALGQQPAPDIVCPESPGTPGPDPRCLILQPGSADRIRFTTGPGTAADHAAELLSRADALGLRIQAIGLGIQAHDETGPDVARATRERGLTSFQSASLTWQGRAAHRITRTLLERWREEGEHGPGPGAAASPGPAGQAPAPVTGPGSRVPLGQEYVLEHASLVSHLPAGTRRLLDVSCGSGARGARIKEATGAHVTGIESGLAMAEAARTRLDEVWQLDLNTSPHLPGSEEPFDVILMAGVIDRLADPAGTLAALIGVLREGGLLIVTVPNLKHWSIILPLLLQDRFTYAGTGPVRPSSLRFFTMIEAAAMLRQAGLEQVEVAAATSVPLADPAQLDPLVQAMTEYGADPVETRTLLDAYEFVFTARRAPGGPGPGVPGST